jgi:regulator of replication initiation timing
MKEAIEEIRNDELKYQMEEYWKWDIEPKLEAHDDLASRVDEQEYEINELECEVDDLRTENENLCITIDNIKEALSQVTDQPISKAEALEVINNICKELGITTTKDIVEVGTITPSNDNDIPF